MVEYRNLPGLIGYRVGSDGHVYSRWVRGYRGSLGTRWKKLRVRVRPGGYPFISVRRFGVLKNLATHRLVLEAFVGPCPDGMEGCHNNGNKLDNRLVNLRWDTRSSNITDSYNQRGHRSGESHYWSTVSEETVVRLKALAEEGVSYAAIERALGLIDGYVGKCVRGERRVRG